MAELKTAKDMPEGSQVMYRGELWTIEGEACQRRWTAVAYDHNVDTWLADGAQIVFIPSGRGRWLKEQEARRG